MKPSRRGFLHLLAGAFASRFVPIAPETTERLIYDWASLELSFKPPLDVPLRVTNFDSAYGESLTLAHVFKGEQLLAKADYRPTPLDPALLEGAYCPTTCRGEVIKLRVSSTYGKVRRT